MTIFQKFLKCLLTPIAWPIVRMPGKSHRGALPVLLQDERTTHSNVERHVRALAEDIGERTIRQGLDRAAQYIRDQMELLGFQVGEQEFFLDGQRYCNLDSQITGAKFPERILVVGAHYDTVFGTPGADDNATGVAALLELARMLKDAQPDCTIRLVFFANEEHPLHQHIWEAMGSWFYAKRCHDRNENVIGMLSLEMLGVYSEVEGSQKYPAPFNLFYPTKGNFIGFVGNLRSRSFVHKVVSTFRRHTAFPSEGVAAPEMIKDIARSDHWAFWQFNWPALMVTDTSNFRYPLYHTPHDTCDKLDFEKLARVTRGISRTVLDLASHRLVDKGIA